MSDDAAIEQRAIGKVCRRLVPFLGLMFFINFLDRTAISFAGPHGLTRDLGLTAAQYGLAAGVFFIGYILFEVPSNLALHRFGARRWMARIMVSWGVVALLFTWVESATGLYWLRFLLGVAEAGFFPGAVLYLSLWVPDRHRGRVLALFYLAQPLTVVIGAPLAATLMQQEGLLQMAGWRIMFFGVAVPAIAVGIATWFVLPDGPADARWLAPEEKAWLLDQLAREERTRPDPQLRRAGRALLDGQVWALALVYFGLIYGMYALAFFLPTIVGGFQRQFGARFGMLEQGLVTAVPYLAAAAALFLWCRRAQRGGVASRHIALPALVGAISVPAALYMQTPGATVAVITVTACAIFAALPNFWTVPARLLSGAGAAAGIALINTVGNVAGFVAPLVTGVVKDASGSYHVPMFVVGALMLASSVLIAWLGRRPRGPGARATQPRAAEPPRSPSSSSTVLHHIATGTS